jgi:chemotaxis protein methyltransferase CheR
MNREDYESFRTFLSDACGITLADNKQYLIEHRLNPLLAEFRVASLKDLVGQLRLNRHSPIYARVIDAMTTNETQWFRDVYPFEILKRYLLPELLKNRMRAPRIWSAACSSGQEPYSISIAIDEYLRVKPVLPLPDIQVVATDISPSMLEQGESGLYDDLAITRGLSEERRRANFVRRDGRWLLNADVRRRVAFRELNLTQGYEALGKFDVVFCRNVLIYFSLELKRSILGRIAGALHPRGYLVVGGSESLAGYTEAFEMVRFPEGIVYRLKAPVGARVPG